MENIVKEYMDRFDRNHRRQHRYVCLLGVLALLVCLAVFWRLKLVGTAMTNEASCGLQEHTHTDSCYTTVLACTVATSETAAGEHVHTDDCYKRKLVCTIPEHTHTADCYSDAEADTEGESDWTQSFPQEALTGDWAQDTVTIAASQMGYAESTRNWQLNDDGTRSGYTRYGAWYGSPYGGWNGMFAAFCLHYAGVDEEYLTTANAAGVNAWAVALYQKGELQGPGHEAVPGDIVFLGHDDKIETCAVVADVAEEDGVPTLTLIAGDVDNTVEELTVPADSDAVLGYAATAEAYAAYTQDYPDGKHATDETAEPAATATPETAGPESTEKPFATLENNAASGTLSVQTEPLDLAGSYEATIDGTATTKYYMTDAYAESTTYDTVNNYFKTKLCYEFAIPTQTAKDVNGHMILNLADGIQIPETVLGKQYTGKNGDDDAFDFTLQKGADGRYYVDMKFCDEFLQNFNQDMIEGDFYFDATTGADKIGEDGSLKFTVREKLDLTIKSDEIKYPDKDETARSDIHVEKSGSYLSDSGELYYEVVITSKKGTPDKITITDTLTELDGVNIESLEIASVTLTDDTHTDVDVTAQCKMTAKGTDNKSFTYELPKLEKAADAEHPSTYKVVYKYKLANPPKNGSYSKTAANTLVASSTNTQKNDTVTDTDTANVDVKHEIISKTGSYDSKNSVINWTITLNNLGQNDVAGKSLTDTMFAENEKDVSGKIPADDFKVKTYYFDKDGKNHELKNDTTSYTIETVTGADGKKYIKDVKFNAVEEGKNNYRYVITYKTTAEAQFNEWKQYNKAEFDGVSDDATVNVPRPGNIINKTAEKQPMDADGYATVKWTVTVTAPSGGIPKDTQATDFMSCTRGDNYLTKAQAEALYNELSNLEWVDKNSIKFRAKQSGSAEKWPQVSWNELGNDAQVTYVDFKLAKDVPDGISWSFSYCSTVKMQEDLNRGETTVAKNKFKLGEASVESSVKYYKYGVEKRAVGSNWGKGNKITSRDTEFSWSVKIYYEKTPGDKQKELTIVDTLPKDVELTKIWMGVTEDYGSMWRDQTYQWDGNKFTKLYDGEGAAQKLKVNSIEQEKQADGTTKVTLKLDPTDYVNAYSSGNQNQWFHVCYTCKLTQEAWDAIGPGETKLYESVTNTVDIATEDGKPYGSASASEDLNFDRTSEAPKAIGKTGTINGEDHTLDYRVELNPYGKTYPTDDSWLHLVDKLNLATRDEGGVPTVTAYPLEGSVQLYHATRNEDGSLTEGEPLSADEWSWEYQARTNQDAYYYIKAKVPNGMPLVLKYRYKVEYTGTQDKVNIWAHNDAELSSATNGSASNEKYQDWVIDAGGGSVKNTLTLVKVDSRSASITIPGAKFRVYKVDKDGTAHEMERFYTTGSDGTIRITKDDSYDYNTIYFLQEVEAPYPYTANPDAKYYFYFSHPNRENNLPDNYIKLYNPINLTQTSRTDYVPNTKESLDVEVTKHWTTDDGHTPLDSTFRSKSVTVRLMRFAVSDELWEKYQRGDTLTEQERQTLEQGRAEAEEVTNAELNETNKWKRAFRYLSVKAGEEQRYIYFVTEDSVPGFNTDLVQTQPVKDTNGIWQISVDVTNRMISDYELPKTGGNGTLPYMAGGLALMAAALLCGYCKKRRKEGRQNG